MAKKKALEQHIAVFGQSGSGKTVLLSSFFGAMTNKRYAADPAFNFVADNSGQGTDLLQKYFRMRDDAQAPAGTVLNSTAYEFSLRLKKEAGAGSSGIQAVRLVWHDYPGEWLTEDPEDAGVQARRVETFRSLLESDVALLLVDGEKLNAHVGQEESYLGALFGSVTNSLLNIKDDLLGEEGKPLVTFPRIWIIALSKADVLPDLDVAAFQELMIKHAGHHMGRLREAIESFVVADGAVSVGEDFLLLSSARFEPGQIDVDQNFGIDLMLPIAAFLPMERHVKWADAKVLPLKAAREVLNRSSAIVVALGAAGAFLGKLKLPGLAQKAVSLVALVIGKGISEDLAKLAGSKLDQALADATAKKEHITAALLQFGKDLENAEKNGYLRRSVK